MSDQSSACPVRSVESCDAAWGPLFAAWLAATASALGALFLSEVTGVAPCVLCWYQRVFMFPLAVVLTVALFPLDLKVIRYAAPLAAAGWLVALFHVLLTHGYIPERVTPCTQGIPCSQIDAQWFGFLTIPILSLLSFSAIGLALGAAYHKARQ
ncbi:disulfide bond formation protein B [Ramlibacter lithotrophicus]|uniref:disulfide bond formation protein B n=1 Tax=Ramlibacter lithotrophicus TaxID=2606681 RepID=UPI0015F2C043|nr:disulfide bond formation protein B [Ramlibacter lithotrophicus]